MSSRSIRFDGQREPVDLPVSIRREVKRAPPAHRVSSVSAVRNSAHPHPVRAASSWGSGHVRYRDGPVERPAALLERAEGDHPAGEVDAIGGQLERLAGAAAGVGERRAERAHLAALERGGRKRKRACSASSRYLRRLRE